jgi:hypothetical protein
MARADTGSVGRQAEAMALGHLKAQGLKAITTNFRCRMGEIDLVMRDSFLPKYDFEVRTALPGQPAPSITTSSAKSSGRPPHFSAAIHNTVNAPSDSMLSVSISLMVRPVSGGSRTHFVRSKIKVQIKNKGTVTLLN